MMPCLLYIFLCTSSYSYPYFLSSLIAHYFIFTLRAKRLRRLLLKRDLICNQHTSDTRGGEGRQDTREQGGQRNA